MEISEDQVSYIKYHTVNFDELKKRMYDEIGSGKTIYILYDENDPNNIKLTFNRIEPLNEYLESL